ncbi:hypothetical protein GOQ27_05635 [Clostridium sp. D2Q-11]|uniref:Uncharacterized protein n=1 Tax=Anaeromonas frigoriresistens TaxID=2683708 RepID=A0A942URN0_9FIRM|nr:hypothetical protein [Anaeromonas frigoriresistens]MBS4537933.1 hypothetical protein [Anaeromonas frigoriresistens]
MAGKYRFKNTFIVIILLFLIGLGMYIKSNIMFMTKVLPINEIDSTSKIIYIDKARIGV